MNRNKVMLVAVAMVGFLFAASAQALSEKVTVIGKVYETKDINGNLETVKIVSENDKVYWVVLDAKGEQLGTTMAGKVVKVVGILRFKGEDKWLTVEDYEEFKQ